MPGGVRQSTLSSAREGMTLIFSLALMHRRRQRHAEHRLDQRGQPRVAPAQRLERGASAASESSPMPRPSSSSLGPSVTSKPARPARMRVEQRRELQQRVVADARACEAWPAAPSVATREAEDALLGHADAVAARPPSNGITAPAPSLRSSSQRTSVGVVLAEPDRAVRPADLLVDDHDDEQVARAGPPALAGQRRGRDHLGGRLRLHVDRPAAPQLAVDHLARPRVVPPLLGVGEHRVDVREQAERRAVGAAAQARDEVRPRPRCARGAGPRSRRRVSSAASSSCSGRSFPGGFTVS